MAKRFDQMSASELDRAIERAERAIGRLRNELNKARNWRAHKAAQATAQAERDAAEEEADA